MALTGLLTACQQSAHVPEDPGPDSTLGAVRSLVAADDHGAIVRDSISGELMGIASDSTEVWREPDLTGVAVCVLTCPQAIVTGSVDALNSPLIATPPAHYRGSVITQLPAAFQMWAPVQLAGSVLVIGTSKAGVAQATWVDAEGSGEPVQLESPSFLWNGPSDGPGILTTETADAVWARLVSSQGGAVHMGDPIRVDGIGGCADATGRAILRMGGAVRLVDATGELQPVEFNLTSEQLGACTITANGFVVSTLTAVGDGAESTLRFFDRTGSLLRSVTEAVESIPQASTSADRVAYATPEGIDVVTMAGEPLASYPGAVQAQFTRTGTLVLLSRDGAVEWRQA